MRLKGFTLIELLVVIAIIALLMAVIIPSLSIAKKKAASVVCMSNTRQMSLAWYMYQDENDGKLMGSRMENVGNDNECREAWIGQPHKATDNTTSTSNFTGGPSDPVTDEDEIRGMEKGKLHPYMENADVYHCPADRLRKGPDGTRLYVSYAIPICLNGFTNPASGDYDFQVRKFGRITSPSDRYNFVESGERSRGNWTYGGYFIMATPNFYGNGNYGMWSPLAISHGNSAVFGFADAHAESHKWHDEAIFEHYWKTEDLAPGSTYDINPSTDIGESADFDWMIRGWAYRDK